MMIADNATMIHDFPDLCIICEGESDRVILSELTKRLLAGGAIKRRVEIRVAHGKMVIPRVVRALESRFSPDQLAIVVDSDGDLLGTRRLFKDKLKLNEYWLIIADPSVESWIVQNELGRDKAVEGLRKLAMNANLRRIGLSHPEFKELEEVVTSFPLPQ
jgi:hypothetical protein